MLTIFALPKRFVGHIGIIQRNAIQSWTRLSPRCEVILCGNDSGTAETAKEFGIRHLPDIACNELGTPLLSSAFETVTSIARFPLLCYVNADIILLDDFIEAVKRISFSKFLLVGRRWDVDLEYAWNFEQSDWQDRLREYALQHGKRARGGGSDFFVFVPDGQIERLPDFAVGRPYWDNWFFFHARKLGLPVIDATEAALVIHQNHDYAHVRSARGQSWQGPEGDKNLALIRAENAYPFKLLDATYLMTKKGVVPARSLKYLRRRVYTMQFLAPSTRKPIQLIYQLWHAVRTCRK